MTCSVWQRRRPISSVKNGLNRLLGPVVAHPQQNPPLQIVNHGEIDLALASAHLVDPNDMHGRPRPVFQPVLHRPFHNGSHALPIQSVLACRALPTQFPRQLRHCIGQSGGHPRPGFGPGKVLHPHSAAGTFHPTRAIAQLQRQFPQGQIRHTRCFRTSCTFRHRCRHTPHRRSRRPSRSMWTTMHLLGGLFHLRHGVGFQAAIVF